MTLLRHTLGRAAWLLLGALAVAAWVSRGGGDTDTAAQGWMATIARFHATTRVLWGETALHLHHEARLRQDSAQLDRNLQVAWHQVEGLVTSLDSLHRQPLTPAVRRYAEACGESINNCAERAGLLAQALETEHARGNMMSNRLALADSIIGARAKAQTCHFLLVFGCVSRTQAAELGLLGGVILTLVVRH